MFIVESRANLEKHNLSQSLVIADYKGYLFIIQATQIQTGKEYG